jgi:hypothetical protein
MRRALLCVLTLALLAAVPAFARVDSVESGIDVWRTDGDGTSFVDFGKMPIPKGFFCEKSAPFTARVVLRGRPLATGNPNELGGADTIVQRLDHASFDTKGQATTRIQIRALQLESVKALATACGDYNMLVLLEGQQPVSRMKIVKETEVSGHFVAPIRVNFKLIFTPVSGLASRTLELRRNFNLQPAPHAGWLATTSTSKRSTLPRTLAVDTNADSVPDTFLPKTSGGFQVGVSRARLDQIATRAARGLKTEMQPVSCSRQIDYGDYGSYGCHSGADPDCHPHTEATGVHCSQACAPCDSADLPISDP